MVSTVAGVCSRFCFFFSSRRRHTRCSRDWSSDVCSSDLAVIVGNEGAGIRPQLNAVAAQRVAIPLAQGAESLNVAVAAGILLYGGTRGRRSAPGRRRPAPRGVSPGLSPRLYASAPQRGQKAPLP